MMEEQDKQAQQCADVIGVLAAQNRGDFIIECGRQFQELVESVKRTGKKGKLMMSLEVEVAGLSKDGMVNQLSIYPTVTLKEPQPGQGSTLFFLTEDNKLTQDNPAQMAMFEGVKKNV